MKTVGVICEYNPFHLGHVRHLCAIREAFGEDAAIVAVMSGNYVQRGDVAITDKYTRARCAVENGVSLVLELPFPYSCASAEYFARAGVSLVTAAGADVLSFGSECGDIGLLQSAASHLKNCVPADPALPFAVSRAGIYAEKYGAEEAALLGLPNNILALEYCKALTDLKSPAQPHTVRRFTTDTDVSGATAIREALKAEDFSSAAKFLPEISIETYQSQLSEGQVPAEFDRLSAPILCRLRDEKESGSAYAECGGGVYERLCRYAGRATSLSALLSLAATKKYTNARLRRALLYSFFRVTADALSSPPAYTQVLAMDTRGQTILKHIRAKAEISVLTKPADHKKLSPEGQRQAACARYADSVYTLSLPCPTDGEIFMRSSPYCK